MEPIKVVIWDTVLRSNITQLITTQKKVYSHASTLGSFLIYLPSQSFSMVSRMPKYSPQKMKFQLAPCQKPVRDQTIIRFRTHFHLLTRLPPKGIYTYSRNQVLRVICHLRQKSVMLVAW